MWRHLPAAYPAKAAPPFSSSKHWLHSCRLSIAEKCGANNWWEQSKAPLTVWYEIHTSTQPIQQRNWRSKSDNQSMGTCKDAFPLHIPRKQWCPLALWTMNCAPADYRLQNSMGQLTNRNGARLPSLFGMKFTQVPSQYSKGIGEVKATIEVWVHAKGPSCCVSCESSTALQLFEQWTALLQTINCRKVWGKQPTGTEQGSSHCSVWNSHKCQARIRQPICRTNHVAQQFICLSLENGTEKWRKAVLDNLWKSHIDRHSLASFLSVGSRWLSQNNRLQFGNKLIFVNYMYMDKNEFK
jgi:hypothetical protein